MIEVIGHEEPSLEHSNPVALGTSLWFVLAIIIQVAILAWLFVCKPHGNHNVNRHSPPMPFSALFDL